MTRRGRIVVFLLAVGVLLAIAMTFGSSTSANEAGGTAVTTTAVTVEPDQTLWEIAADANPHGDIQRTVDQIMKLNSLPSATDVQMGDQIAVPVYP